MESSFSHTGEEDTCYSDIGFGFAFKLNLLVQMQMTTVCFCCRCFFDVSLVCLDCQLELFHLVIPESFYQIISNFFVNQATLTKLTK